MTQIYLISPPKIDLKQFSADLEKALKTDLVPVFQMRLKGYEREEVAKISRELLKICQANNTQFIVNDDFDLALEIGAHGVHLGAEDGSVKLARQKSQKINPNFVIGASCYDSRHLAMEAGEQGADYVSFGAFFESKTKKSRGKPTLEILHWANEITNLPIVAIGGIDDQNCSSLVKAGADFLAVISYVWDNEKGVAQALKTMDEVIKKA